MQKCVNRTKTDLTKTALNRFYNKNLDKFQISSHLSCGEMWNFSKFGPRHRHQKVDSWAPGPNCPGPNLPRTDSACLETLWKWQEPVLSNDKNQFLPLPITRGFSLSQNALKMARTSSCHFQVARTGSCHFQGANLKWLWLWLWLWLRLWLCLYLCLWVWLWLWLETGVN